MSSVHYFGCIGQAGHYLFESHDGRATKSRRSMYDSWMNQMDGKLAPRDIGDLQGPTARHEIHGHTVLAFWDRSVDHRPASNSTLFVPGIMSFAEAVEVTRKAFPEVFDRLDFEITEHIT